MNSLIKLMVLRLAVIKNPRCLRGFVRFLAFIQLQLTHAKIRDEKE